MTQIQNLNEQNTSTINKVEIDISDVTFMPYTGYTEVHFNNGTVIRVQENMEQIRELQMKKKTLLFG